MKKIFIALLAIASVAACNKAEVIDTAEGDLISFGNAFVDNATKADYSTDDVEEINVYGTVNGVKIFDYATVEKTDIYGEAWRCDVTQYWIEGAAYKFAALVDVPQAKIKTDDATGMPVSFTYTADGVTDVLYDYAVATGKASGENDIVSFTFKHLLAKAYFTATSETNDARYTYSITNVKVTSTYPDGTYTVYTSPEADAVGTWGSYGAASSTAFASIVNVVYNTPKTNAEILLIPGATVGVSFDYTLYIDENEVITKTYTKADVVTLAQNSVYNFNISLSANEPIQFTVTEKPEWNATTNKDFDVSI